MENLNEKIFFTNKDNFIYYRNLFIRFLKSVDLYHKIIVKLKTLDALEKKLEELIPEHYYGIVDDILGVDKSNRNVNVAEYLTLLTKYTLPKHREKAISMAYNTIDEQGINLNNLNHYIINERKNCLFKSFEGTIFDDSNINCFDKLTKYTPISLMFYYIGGRNGVPINNYRNFYTNWMYTTSKLIYNE